MNLSLFLESFNQHLTLFVIFPAILILGFYLTWRLNWVQLFQMRASFFCLIKKEKGEEGNISRFEAVAAVLAGNFGTGNISGMAIALATGGPGALVWMWVMAFFGAAIQYASCVLSVHFRYKRENGEYVGGPMYYLRDGLGFKGLAILFSVFAIFGAITVGNFAQINSLILPLEKMGFNPFYCSLLIAALVAVVILGGIQRIARFATYVVPFKAAIYLGTAIFILLLNYEKVLPAFQLMFHAAFDLTAFTGGLLGFGIFRAIKTGFDRGLFATDAGTGIVPILQASARSQDPVMDGIATLVAPLMVMIVCTTTGLVLIVTGAWQESGLQSTNMVTHAFTTGLDSAIGGYIVMGSLLLFAYTTILAWSYCGEKALGFLIGARHEKLFRIVYVLLIPVTTLIHVNTIWILADIAISLMLLINLIGVTCLSKLVIEATSTYQLKRSLIIDKSGDIG